MKNFSVGIAVLCVSLLLAGCNTAGETIDPAAVTTTEQTTTTVMTTTTAEENHNTTTTAKKTMTTGSKKSTTKRKNTTSSVAATTTTTTTKKVPPTTSTTTTTTTTTATVQTPTTTTSTTTLATPKVTSTTATTTTTTTTMTTTTTTTTVPTKPVLTPEIEEEVRGVFTEAFADELEQEKLEYEGANNPLKAQYRRLQMEIANERSLQELRLQEQAANAGLQNSGWYQMQLSSIRSYRQSELDDLNNLINENTRIYNARVKEINDTIERLTQQYINDHYTRT